MPKKRRENGHRRKLGLLAAVAWHWCIVGRPSPRAVNENLGGTGCELCKNIQASGEYKGCRDYMATANKMGSLFQGSGMDQQKSLDMTSDAMQRAADVASVMGIDTSMAMDLLPVPPRATSQ